MKKWIRFELAIVLFAILISSLEACRKVKSEVSTEIADTTSSTETSTNITAKEMIKHSTEFKNYWYSGKAEITSYKLNQARYGELREGSSVLIFVTEPFAAEKQVKADENRPTNIPVLKLNSTKNYLTGIYPYTIMTSSFLPVNEDSHALKVSFSAQEWCGQVYAQLNNKNNYEITSHSYFESEGDQDFSLDKTTLEDEIWNKIRINPENLPTGNLKIIPSFEFIRLSHKEFKAYAAVTSLNVKNDTISTYTISYPELERTLEIDFTTTFPHSIIGWTETSKSGFGQEAKLMTTTAVKIKTIITPYWQQNKNSDLFLRDSLGI